MDASSVSSRATVLSYAGGAGRGGSNTNITNIIRRSALVMSSAETAAMFTFLRRQLVKPGDAFKELHRRHAVLSRYFLRQDPDSCVSVC